jgi:hypothetical protein
VRRETTGAGASAATRDELRYILDPADVMGDDYPSEALRVRKNNEIGNYGEYRTRRLVLEAWDRLETGDLKRPAASRTRLRLSDAPNCRRPLSITVIGSIRELCGWTALRRP